MKPLFDGNSPAGEVRPGDSVWFYCNGGKIKGRLRHLNRPDMHFGLDSNLGGNLGHFGYTASGVVYRKTMLPPNRKNSILKKFTEESNEDRPGKTGPDGPRGTCL